jgi:murein endopeptidase
MRRFAVAVVAMFLTGCAMHAARPSEPSQVPLPPAPVAVAPSPATLADAGVAMDPVTSPETGDEAPEVSAADGDDSDEGPAAVDEEGESHEAPADGGVVTDRYTGDLSDAQLADLWKNSPEKLGSISIGFADEGRMVNSVQFPRDGNWKVVSPDRAYGTQETIDDVIRAIKTVLAQYPDSPPLRVNQISAKDGGYLKPHKSHQSGRDVDLAFYYPTADPVRAREREKYIDVKRTWALLRAVIIETDVQKVLLDRHVQKVLYDYALKSGEDKAWLDSIFHAGRDSIVVHARHHRDHMHVRFFNGRAQELGRRVAPLLALRPDQNLTFHRVHSGDTLGAIARHYGSSVEALRRANHIKGSMLHLAQVLRVPLHGPCTKCPVPAEVIVPARHLPPQLVAAQPIVASTKVADTASTDAAPASPPAVAGTSPVEAAVMKPSAGVAPPIAAAPTENVVTAGSTGPASPPPPSAAPRAPDVISAKATTPEPAKAPVVAPAPAATGQGGAGSGPTVPAAQGPRP